MLAVRQGQADGSSIVTAGLQGGADCGMDRRCCRRGQDIVNPLAEQGFLGAGEEDRLAGEDIDVASFGIHFKEQVRNRLKRRRQVFLRLAGDCVRFLQCGQGLRQGRGFVADLPAEHEIPEQQDSTAE